MTLYAGTIPPELLKLAMDIASELTVARGHIADRNYGIADSWIAAALEKLPRDTGVQIIWPELEDRTT